LDGFKGPTSERKGRGGKEREEKEEKERGG